MAIVLTQVDRTTGNFEDVFIYTIHASFNGIAGDIDSAKIKFFLPESLTIHLGDVGAPVQNIEEEIVVGGKNIIFNFGAITDLGIAVRLGLGMVFNRGFTNYEEYIFSPEMIINGIKILESNTEPIRLVIETRFELSREVILPKTDPAPGGAVYYKVTLQNLGDLGGKIENVIIHCGSIAGLSIDSSFIVTGMDKSQNGFEDISQDGLLGTISANAVEFTIPMYYGQSYEFIYKAIIEEDNFVGVELNTMAQWSIDGINKTDDLHTLLLGEAEYSALISLYGPDYTFLDEYICYEINIENDGNQILELVELTEELPPEIQYYEFETGIFHIGEIQQEISMDYTITYDTQNGLVGILGPYNANANTTIQLDTFMVEGDNLSKLTWSLQAFGIGVSSKKSPHIKGKIKESISIGTSILNHLEFTWMENETIQFRFFNHSTTVDNRCILRPKFSQSLQNIPVKPNQIIRYKIGANCRRSRLNNPIFAMILPSTLEYVGNVTAQYTDHFVNGVTPVTPPVVLQEDFIEQGNTLVTFSFVGAYAYNFKQNSNIQIAFDTQVKVGAKGEISTNMLLNTSGSTGIIPSGINVYRDNHNIAQDPSVSMNYAQSGTKENSILFFVSTSSNKKVKGFMDYDFIEEPLVGKTLEGGELYYKISVKNIGNTDLEQVEIVDIFPYIGDSGVIETATERKSAYGVSLTSEVIAKIIGEDGMTLSHGEFDIYYSKSINPVRFGGQFDIIGIEDTWLTTPPLKISDTKSIKIVTKNTSLLPKQTLEIMLKAIVPVGTGSGQIAWNSFAADVIYKDLSGVEQHLLAIEPEKVGIEIVEPSGNKGKILGFVWIDKNKNGIPTEEELRISDVGVVLYNDKGTPLRATFTTENINGVHGQYTFGNLDMGTYYVKFFIEDNKYGFTKQVTTLENGSQVDRNTGATMPIYLSIEQNEKTINAGIIEKQYNHITTLLAVNRSARSMVRNVIYDQMLIGMKYEDAIELTKPEKI